MTRTIWKFPLQVVSYQEIEIPDGTILHVATQNDQPCLWAEVMPTAEKTSVGIHIYGTGHPLAIGRGDYLGTFMLQNGALVLHVYGPATI